ncbi:DUF1854 domain-containing protein [Candidatus Poribacteria bacterium]
MGAYNIEEELTILDPKELSIYRDEFNRLRLKMEGNGKNGDNEEHPAVVAVMGFPLTNPDQFISIIGMKDGKKDKEIGIIEDTKKLDSKSRKILKGELKRAYFMPQITKINRLKEDHGMMKFDVDTDKGQREFETRYKEDIRKLKGGHVVIKDSDGNRYEIKDYRRLDQKSVVLIDSEI